jgi:hypothetical protein
MKAHNMNKQALWIYIEYGWKAQPFIIGSIGHILDHSIMHNALSKVWKYQTPFRLQV